ncbi:MAG: HPr family phosphocarrier protein [Eubacteriales bacterium]|jgi:phosphocarrier protein
MKEFKYVITDNEGIHARPAGELIKLTKSFSSDIKLTKDGRTVDAKKLIAVMSLGAKKDMEVTFTFDGADEDAACEAVSKFMKENL